MRRELSRVVLPVGQYTEMYAKVDLHNLFHFLKLRLDKHAQYEIRVYAEAILDIIKPIVPIAVEAFEDYVLNSVTFSGPEIKFLDSLFASYLNKDNKRSLLSSLDSNKNNDNYLPNKREYAEFLNKIKKLL